MPKVFVSSVLNAPVNEVWKVIGEFDAVPEWHPDIKECNIENFMSCDTVGCMRDLTMPDGAKIREKLVTLSYDDHMYKYTIVEGQLPVKNYNGTLRLRPITDGNRTYIEWSSEFDVALEQEAEMVGTISGVFISGLDSLKKRFGTD
ncbi:MAG: SRPBCC family protein [Acidiferrobacterales bacterium]